MKKYQIYALIDPQNQEIRYVGKTCWALSKRLSSHFKDKAKTHKTCWIVSLKKLNLKPLIKLLEVCTEENWQERERYWISTIGKGGLLTNTLNGGDGLPKGYKHSPEAIEKIRAASKRANKGKFTSENRPEVTKKAFKRVLQYSLDGVFIAEWEGIVIASESLRIHKNSIVSCLKGATGSAGNFLWKYHTVDYPLSIGRYIDRRFAGSEQIHVPQNNLRKRNTPPH